MNVSCHVSPGQSDCDDSDKEQKQAENSSDACLFLHHRLDTHLCLLKILFRGKQI